MCAIDGCDRPARGRGWCVKHYKRWRRHKDPTVVFNRGPKPTDRRCSLVECDTRHYARGFCQKHYRRWKRHGDPTVSRPPRSRPPDRPEFALLDQEIARLKETGW